MAISYLSKPLQGQQYILPLDLSLLEKVNNYKQTLFYKNASALKQQFSQIKNSDIMNPEQKARLEDAYNQLTIKINEAGGLDYSDLGIVSQIEGLGAEIYDDEYIMSGIVSTKKVRKLHSIYEKFKTDPKYAKLYSIANETWDNEYVQDYLKGGVDATYNGNGTPTVYLGNSFDLLTKRVKEIKPDVQVGYNQADNNVYFFNVKEQKAITGDKLQSLMQAALTPELRNQMQIEGWYNGRGMDNTQIKNEMQLRQDDDIRSANSNIERLTNLMNTSPKEEEKAFYKEQIEGQKGYITTIQDRYNERLRTLSKDLSTREGRASILGTMYMTDMMRNAITAFSSKEIKNTLKSNAAQIHKDKMDFNYNSLNTNAQLEMMKEQGRNDRALLQASNSNSPNGKETTDTDLFTLSNNTDAKDDKLSQVYSAENMPKLIEKEGKSQYDNLTNFFVQNGGSEYSSYLDKARNYNGSPDLTVDELKTLFKKETQMSSEAKQYFTNIISLFDKAAKGDNTALEGTNFNIPDFINNVYKPYTLAQTNIDYYKGLEKDATKHAINTYATKKNMNAKETELLTQMMNNRSYFFDNSRLKPQFKGTDYENLIKKYDLYVIDASQERLLSPGMELYNKTDKNLYYVKFEYLNKIANDEFYEKHNAKLGLGNSLMLNYKNISQYQSSFQSFAKTNDVQMVTKDGETIDKSNMNVDDMKLISANIIPYGSKIGDKEDKVARLEVQYKNGDNLGTGYIYINQSQAGAMNIPILSDIEVKEDWTLKQKGSLMPSYNTVSTWKDNNVIKTNIVYVGGQIQLFLENGGKNIKLTKFLTKEGQYVPFVNANQARYLESTLIDLASKVDRESFMEQLNNLANTR